MTAQRIDTVPADAGHGARGHRSDTEPLLSVRDLVQEFVVREAGGARGGVVQAVSGVSFDIMPGETLGIVGETGSGKSTLARAVLQAPRPKSGSVVFRGADLTRLRGGSAAAARRHMQFVWQDPFGSLDPKWQVGRSSRSRWSPTGTATAAPAASGSTSCSTWSASTRRGTPSATRASCPAARRSGSPSPGPWRSSPSLLICDEAVSSLDVLIQAQVLNLFERLRRELGLSYLFIAHDLALVKQVCDRVGVMYLGMFCEVGPGELVYKQPLHPYTKALLDSIPSTEPGAARATATIKGEPPSPIDPPSGCRFRTRCPRATDQCALRGAASPGSSRPGTWWPATTRSPSRPRRRRRRARRSRRTATDRGEHRPSPGITPALRTGAASPSGQAALVLTDPASDP